jgi:hypothetical protein
METKTEHEEESMKKVAVLCVGLVLGFAGLASADSLTVNAAAAMGGTSYGLEVYHDNTDRAYVQDNTPDFESTYRATFLFNVGDVTVGTPKNFRQSLFRAIGPNPNPGVGSCDTDPGFQYAVIQLWLYQTGGLGQFSNLQLWGKGNQCGDQGTVRIPLNNNQDYRVCIEYQTGAAGTGFVALAVTDPASACPVSGDPAWVSVFFGNNLTSVDIIRLGTTATNTFGAGETCTFNYDEFASFRTLSPG